MQPQRLYQYFLLISLWLFTSTAFANSPIILSNESFNYSITPYISIYEDSSQQLTIDEIASLEYLLLFTPIHAETVKLGISDSNFWFRFSITNPYDHPTRAIFSLSDSDFDLINFYSLESDNNHFHYTTKHLDRSIRGGLLQKHTLLIYLPANSTQTYLLQAHSQGLITALASVQSLDNYTEKEQRFFAVIGISIGLLIGSGLFFTYLWFIYRLFICLPALVAISMLVVYQVSVLGYLEVITNISAYSTDKISELSLGLVGFAQLSAALSLRWVKYHKLIRAFIFACALSLIPMTITTILVMPVAAMPIVVAFVITANAIGALVLALGTSSNIASQRWLCFGYTVTAVVALTTLLTSYNLLSFDSFAIWSLVVLPFICVLFLIGAASCQVPRINAQQGAPKHLPSQHQLLTQITEDLRSPVNSVFGISDLLKDTPLSPQQKELNNALTEAGNDLLHSINQVSNIAYLYSNEIKLTQEPVNLLELVSISLSYLQHEATRKKVELILDYSEDLPKFINSDLSRLFIIIHTILKRALTYTEHGEINVSVKPFNIHKDFGVLLQVQLISTIIRPDELKSSFSVLQYQNNLAIDKKHEWHLLLTRFLIKKMHARLEVESMTLQGASLSLSISLPKEQTAQHSSVLSGVLNGKQLLIVDDNASLRSVLEKQAKRWGLRVSSTYSCKEALALIRNQINLHEPYNFLVLDQDMPVMSGFELAKRIQQDQSIHPKPAIIMLASSNVNDVREEAYNVGIDIVLGKPAYPEHLQQALQDLLPATQTTDRGK